MTDQAQAKTPKTLEQKLEAALALVEKIRAKIAAGTPVTAEIGDTVVFPFGRKENRKELTGVVKGSRTGDNGGVYYAVFVSSEDGFSDQTYKVRSTELISNVTNPNGGTPADADPLAAD